MVLSLRAKRESLSIIWRNCWVSRAAEIHQVTRHLSVPYLGICQLVTEEMR